jgi:peptidoglycan/xylan/chitin deacetylase (PgdA/CDA1 family)
MTRDFVGYGQQLPRVRWPGNARIAISLVLNYEEGAEYSLLDADQHHETNGEVPSPVPLDQRDLFNESMFEYGSRVGVWRLLRLFERYETPVTCYCSALAINRNPDVGHDMVRLGHEICGHGYRWEEHFRLDRDAERLAIRRTIRVLQDVTGVRPRGWFNRYGPSVNTRELLSEIGGFLYDSNALNDDLPYYTSVRDRPWLVVPYSFEVNDARYWRGGLVSIDDFYVYMKSAFDRLYEEGSLVPRMMSVGLHCRISGTPARSVAVERFLAYAREKEHVWFARRMDIASWWRENFPPAQLLKSTSATTSPTVPADHM